MFVQDNRYDASYNYIAYGDKGSWSVRFTAWYLAGLLHRNEGDDLEHAKAAIENIISVQMTLMLPGMGHINFHLISPIQRQTLLYILPRSMRLTIPTGANLSGHS